jgi:hypothetical protein
MSDAILLVDFENVQKLDLALIPAYVDVRIFVGASQAKVPMPLVMQAQSLGTRLEWIRIDGQGSNALDFHIAFYLGEYLAAAHSGRYVILSRDKGFDPLVRHLNARGLDVARVSALADAFPAGPAARGARSAPAARASHAPTRAAQAVPPADPHVARALALLSKADKARRPRTRARLVAQVASYFPKRLGAEDVEALVGRLFADGTISEANGRLSYRF